MFDHDDLEPLLNRMHRIIRKADPVLARALTAERSEAPDDALVHLDRLTVELMTMPVSRNVAGRRMWKGLLRSACRIRVRR